MPEEIKGVVEPKDEPKEEPKEEPTAEQKLETLQSSLDTVNKELEAAREEAKAHQTNVTKKDRDNQKLFDRIGQMEGKFSVLADGIDARRTGDEDEPKGHAVRDAMKEMDTKTFESNYRAMAKEADKIVAGIGKTMDSPELALARNLFTKYADPEEGLAEVRRVVQSIPKEDSPKPPETPKETEDEVKARIKKEVMIEHGLLTPEGQVSGTSAGHFTGKQIAEMSMEEREKKSDEIFEAFRAGRVT